MNFVHEFTLVYVENVPSLRPDHLYILKVKDGGDAVKGHSEPPFGRLTV